MTKRFLVSALTAGLCSSPGCQDYHPPPEPSLVGTDNGIFGDPTAPLRIAFTEPVLPSSLRLVIARYTKPIHEQDPPPDAADVFFSGTPGASVGGTLSMPDTKTVQIDFAKPPPVGPRLVALFLPGLSDPDGHATAANRTLLFGYQFTAPPDGTVTAATKLPSGDYFFLVRVEEPLPIQIKLFTHITVDSATGHFKAGFVSAIRNRDPSRCPTPCSDIQACQLIPSPMCVVPSQQVMSVDEWSDFVTNDVLPTGYSFFTDGFAQDNADGSISFAISPVDVVVKSPPVTVQQVQLTATFSADDQGIYRGEGSLVASQLLIGHSASGQGSGTMSARSIPPGMAPPGIPDPSSGGAGAGGAGGSSSGGSGGTGGS